MVAFAPAPTNGTTVRYYGVDINLVLTDDKGNNLSDTLLSVETMDVTDNGTVDEHWPYYQTHPSFDSLPGGYTTTLGGKQINGGMRAFLKARDKAFAQGITAPKIHMEVQGSKDGQNFQDVYKGGVLAPGAKWTMGAGNVAITNSVTLRFETME